MIHSRFLFWFRSLRERLWIQPLIYAVSATGVVLAVGIVDRFVGEKLVPDISEDTIEKLLTVISASMLGVATFAVNSMVSAYSSAAGSATPRALGLVISDRSSKNALSSFVGAFIFSVVGIVGIKVGYYGAAGRFATLLLTLGILAWVVVTFVRWVDDIARLGRMGNTISKVRAATEEAFLVWRKEGTLGSRALNRLPEIGVPLFASRTGYVQHIDVDLLETWAAENDAIIHLRLVPGAFVSPARRLLTVTWPKGDEPPEDTDAERLREAFIVANRRTFSEDPRFGLVALSEIASRALSPAVNDPGTAIDIINQLTGILLEWDATNEAERATVPPPEGERRVHVPALSVDDMFEDAFAAIERDGITVAELGIRLHKAYAMIANTVSDAAMRHAALDRSRQALERAEHEMEFEPDLERVRRAARSVTQD